MSKKKFGSLRWLIAMALSLALVGGAAPVAAYADPSSSSDDSTSQIEVKKSDDKTDKEDKQSSESAPKPEVKPEPKPSETAKPEPKPDPKPTVDKPVKKEPVADPVEKPKDDDKKADKPEPKPSETAKPTPTPTPSETVKPGKPTPTPTPTPTKPEQPAPKVEQQLDLEGFTCEGVWNRERTVTTYYDKWDSKQGKWVAGTVKEGPWGEYFKVRDLTLAEALEFGCIGDKPVKPDQIKYGEYEGAQPTCENPSVEHFRTIFTTSFTFTAKFVDGEWKWVESSTTTEAKDPVAKTVTLTPEELKKCKPTDPPVKPSPKPTPSETAKPKPSTSTPPASTPPSGSNEDDGDGDRSNASVLPLIGFSLLGAFGLGGLALVARRRRNA